MTVSEAFRNVLIVRTDRIGDVILTLPMAKAIKQQFPGARVTMLVREYTKPLIDGYADIDEAMTIVKERDIAAIIPELRQHQFTHVYCPSPSSVIARTMKDALIPVRIGTAYRWYSSSYFTDKVYDHRKFAQFHEAEANLRMIGPDLKCTPDTYPVSITPSDTAIADVNTWLTEHGIFENEAIAVVHAGSGGSAKDLPLERFAQIALRLRDELRYQVILTGLNKELKLLKALQEMTGIMTLAVDLPLAVLIALIARARCVVSNSTGVLHIAAATGTYAAGMYPPILACSPKRWGPWTRNADVFEPQVQENCNGCRDMACIYHYCMRLISVEGIMSAIRMRVLGQN